MKKLPKVGLLLLVAALVLACGSLAAAQDLIKVGIVNLPPEESGYRQANVEDMNRVFSRENGYDSRQTNTADVNEQMAAAMGYIRDGVDYLPDPAAHASGWDDVLLAAKRAGVRVILFDRLIDTDPDNFEAALVSDMEYEGQLATDWILNNVPEPRNVILIRGQMGSAAEIGRSAPLLKAAEEGKLNIVWMEQAVTPEP